MDSTSLTLLTSEGMTHVTFRPMLTAAQYAVFCDLVTTTQLRSRREFSERLAQLAAEWGVELVVDGEQLR